MQTPGVGSRSDTKVIDGRRYRRVLRQELEMINETMQWRGKHPTLIATHLIHLDDGIWILDYGDN